jgi:glycosyltransferase involved in cell wall biosynthesis
MRLLYSLPHPTDRLADSRAGHVIRAAALLQAIQAQGHAVRCQEAASTPGMARAARGYRRLLKRAVPGPATLLLRDAGRTLFAWRAARRLTEAAAAWRPDAILETHTELAIAGAVAARRLGVPLILDDVSPVGEEAIHYGGGSVARLRAVFRRVCAAASLLVAVTPEIRDHLQAEGIEPGRIVLIENGIDPAAFHPGVDGGACRAALGLAPESVVVVYVGSFQPFHGVPLLLRALATLPPGAPQLLLVGDGPMAAECRALAGSLGIADRVRFAGRRPYREVPAAIAAADIAVVPASNDYGDSMKLRDYMAVGRPVLAPRQDTMARVVEHERTGLLFERDSAPALAAAIARLSADAALRRRLGDHAAGVAAECSWARRAGQLLAAIEELRPRGAPR